MRLVHRFVVVFLAVFLVVSAGGDIQAAPRDGREPGRFEKVVLRLKKLLGISTNDYITPPIPTTAPAPNP